MSPSTRATEAWIAIDSSFGLVVQTDSTNRINEAMAMDAPGPGGVMVVRGALLPTLSMMAPRTSTNCLEEIGHTAPDL